MYEKNRTNQARENSLLSISSISPGFRVTSMDRALSIACSRVRALGIGTTVVAFERTHAIATACGEQPWLAASSRNRGNSGIFLARRAPPTGLYARNVM